MTPVSGHGLASQVAIGVRREKPELLAAIDRALTELKPQIEALAGKYGFPRQRPLNLAAMQSAVAASAHRARDGTAQARGGS